VEGILSKQRYLTGDRLTLSDVRLFTTLIRFDRVYHTHFKCDRKKISEYPALDGFTRELYQHPHIRPTVDFEHCQKHYMTSHKSINPHGIVAHGPPIELLDQPHGRDKLFGTAK
jgi:putative glutathione S-transferase